MPNTRKLDDRPSVTIRSDRRRGGGLESESDIFVTAPGKDTGVTVHGEGWTMSSAEARAYAEARIWNLAHSCSRHSW